MSDDITLERQLEQLGRELGRESQHAEAILRRVASDAALVTPFVRPGKRWRMPWQMPAAVAASLAVCVSVWWLSQPASVYARMLAALADAKTVHASGWTREIVRKWPLEKPAEHGEGAEDEKYEMEAWYWTAPNGSPRAYERQGPVIVTRRGGDMREYQEDADLTFVYEGGYSKDRVAQFGQLAAYLTALQRPSLIKEELGRRLEDGRWVRGIRHIEGDRVEDIWIDEKASLPTRISRERRSSGELVMELTFTFDEPIPESIATYGPPETKYVRHGGGSGVNDEWREHVAEIGRRLQAEPIRGRIAILPREDGRTFANQWALLTPDSKYCVRPLDVDQYQRMTPSYFIDFHASTTDGERRKGTWRLDKKYHDIELPRADLIYEADVPWHEWVQFVLNEFDLEFVEQVENRTIWMARHDGRKLKPWQEVKPPVPYVVEGGVEKKGYVKPGIGHWLRPASLRELFDNFNWMIDRKDLSADKPWIIDHTGLPGPLPYDASEHGTPREYHEKVVSQFYVATDAPYFVGQESLEIAREWYENELGITFIEETRPVTIHVVKKKK